MEQKQQKPYPLRMPDAMREALEQAATNGGRSLHAELLGRLATTLSEEESDAEVERTKSTLLKVRMDLEHALKNLAVAEHRVFLRGERNKERPADAPEPSPLDAFELDRLALLNGMSRVLSEVDALDTMFKLVEYNSVPQVLRNMKDRLQSSVWRYKREIDQLDRVIATHKERSEGADVVAEAAGDLAEPAPTVKRVKRTRPKK